MISHLTPCFIWWPLLDLNQRPSDYESPALTTELRGQVADDYNVTAATNPALSAHMLFL